MRPFVAKLWKKLLIGGLVGAGALLTLTPQTISRIWDSSIDLVKAEYVSTFYENRKKKEGSAQKKQEEECENGLGARAEN